MKELEYNVQLRHIELVSKLITLQPEWFEEKESDIHLNYEMRLSFERKLVYAKLDVTVKDLVKNSLLAHFEIMSAFEVKDFEVVFNKKEKSKIPDTLSFLFKSTLIGAARGILHCELKGTYLYNANIPLLDITQFSEAQSRIVRQ